MKILIVDDDEVARLTLARILDPLGAEARFAVDGEEAYAQLAGGLRAALCCSDLVMPRLDGVGLLQRTRRHPVLKALPFVLVSTAADRPTIEAAVSAGVAGYMLKPFLAIQARCTVDRVLRERRAAASEHFLVTRRRTSLSLEQIEDLLARMQQDAIACAQAPAGGAEGDLQRLQGSTTLLGLWSASSLLDEALAPPTPADARVLLVQEAAHQIGDQLHSLRTLQPGPDVSAGAYA